MRECWALIVASWKTALSYRLSMAFSLVSLIVGIVKSTPFQMKRYEGGTEQ